MTPSHALSTEKRTNVRYLIVFFLFLLTAVNFADRATLSIAGTDMAKALKLDPVAMGYLFSAFSWAYVICQIPGGWLLDRFGSKTIYGWSIALWSALTLLQGFVGGLSGQTAVIVLFALRFLLGAAESPSFPANGRIVAAWFPTAERGTASAIFNSAQYFATVLFSYLMARLTHHWGWESVFWFMGGLGLVFAAAWPRVVYNPREHPWANPAEVAHIAQGGGLVDMEQVGGKKTGASGWPVMRQLLGNRMLLGIYFGQYCITTLTWFFLTWFPIYLVQQRGMTILQVGFVAILPALCGFLGGIGGGVFSDSLLRAGQTLTVARKTPIIAGLLLSMSMVACNYVDSSGAVIAIMCVAFLGKGIGALGWAVISDASPKQITGLSGALFNTFGNIAGITTPIAIGYIVKGTGSFNGALVFVSAHAALAVFSYLFIVGEIRRVELRPA